jgi:hypothetical protein
VTRRLVLALLAALLVALSSRGAAAACAEGVERWARACSDAEHVEVTPSG